MPAAGGYSFGPYLLESAPLTLRREGAPLAWPGRHLDILHALVSHAGEVVPKHLLLNAGWRDANVSENSLAQVLSDMRRNLDADRHRYITTIARHGFKFVAAVTRVEPDATDLAALLEPHRAWTEGRAALETLVRAQIARARATFEQLLVLHHRDARVHVGLANACVMQFEATRTDAEPDVEALRVAFEHADLAWSMAPTWAETWATRGFILERMGRHDEALANLDRAVTLEPDNFVHLLRFASVSWQPQRLEAARRALADCSHLPMAHWLAATVHIARGSLDRAEQHVHAGLKMAAGEVIGAARFSTVGLHWMAGLLCLAHGAEDEALAAFDRELALEPRGHVYARECCANTWYARGACHLRRGNHDAACAAFGEAIARVPRHPMAHAGLAILNDAGDAVPIGAPPSMDHAFVCAALLVWRGEAHAAAGLVEAALNAAPEGNAGWLLPIEPLLDVGRAPEAWSGALSALNIRAR